MNEIKRNFSKWMYYFLLAVAIIFVYKFLDNVAVIGQAISRFFDVITPFLAGALLAYLLYIPASRIEKQFQKSKKKIIKKRARGISVFIIYVLAIALIILLVNVILPVVIDSVIELVSNFQNYWNVAMEKIGTLPDDSILKSKQAEEIVKSVGDSIQNIDFSQYISTDKITGYIKSVIGVASGIFDVFVSFAVSVYILLQRGQIMNFLRKLTMAIFDEKTCDKIEKYVDSTNRIFFKFIPYFGAIVAVAISVLITLITGGISQTLIMAIVVIILQQIDSNIINPKIIGNSLEISPLLVIFAVTVGGAYWGVLGMFLAVPVAAVLKIIIDDWVEFKNSKKYA